jgi:cell division protein FtsL
MRENRWNTATARTIIDSGAKPRARERKAPLLKGLPVGEKLLYLASVVVGVALLSSVLAQYARVTELGVAIRQTEKAIEKTRRTQLQLESERMKLTSPEKIREFAESHGLELTDPKFIPKLRP